MKILIANLGIDYFDPERIKDNKNLESLNELKDDNMYITTNNDFYKNANISDNKYIGYSCYYHNEPYMNYYNLLNNLIKNKFNHYDIFGLIELCDVKNNFPYKNMIIQDYTYPPIEFMNNPDFKNDENSKKTKVIISNNDNYNLLVEKYGIHLFSKYYNWIKVNNYWYNQDVDKYSINLSNKKVKETIMNNTIRYDQSINYIKPLYGNVVISYIFDKVNDKYILLALIHNRFKDLDDMLKFNKFIKEIVDTEDNIIFCGDYNINRKVNNYEYHIKIKRDSALMRIPNEYTILDVDNVYNNDDSCNRKRKNKHMIVFYKLNNYSMSIDEPLIYDCNLHLRTSSHVMIPIILDTKIVKKIEYF